MNCTNVQVKNKVKKIKVLGAKKGACIKQRKHLSELRS